MTKCKDCGVETNNPNWCPQCENDNSAPPLSFARCCEKACKENALKFSLRCESHEKQYHDPLPPVSSGTPMPPPPMSTFEIRKRELNLSRYHRQIITVADAPHPWVDVYAVLRAFKVTDQAIGHAIKKLLDAGNRGVKSKTQDWEEAIMSIKAAIKLEKA